ncbi:hypothetical protein [Kitasatospora albolonga]|uniref:hypothetical protein n=1 Tax=Kitasatospora albolonga TaxID=68173 RepID=UPI0031EBD222
MLAAATAVLDLLLLLVVTRVGGLLLAFHLGGATVAAMRALWYPAPPSASCAARHLAAPRPTRPGGNPVGDPDRRPLGHARDSLNVS